MIERKKIGDTNYVVIGTVSANVTAYQDLNTEESTSYVYRVKAIRDDYTSYYSLGDIVITPDPAPVTRLESSFNFSLTAYPNPVIDVFTVDVDHTRFNLSDAKINGIDGRSVRVHAETIGQAVIFKVDNLPQGMYVLTLPSKKQLYQIKFSKK